MVSVAVSVLRRTGKNFLVPRVKINGAYYRIVLLTEKFLPDIREMTDYNIFQQGCAHLPDGTADERTPNIIPSALRHPNSQDLYPEDFEIWGIMQEEVCRTKVLNVLSHVSVSDEPDQRIIDAAICHWQVRLTAGIEAKGGHFEHKLYPNASNIIVKSSSNLIKI